MKKMTNEAIAGQMVMEVNKTQKEESYIPLISIAMMKKLLQVVRKYDKGD